MSSTPTADSSRADTARCRQLRTRALFIALGYGAVLCVAAVSGVWLPTAKFSIADLGDADKLSRLAFQAATLLAAEVAIFALVGGMFAAFVAKGTGLRAFARTLIGGIALSFTMALLTRACQHGGWPTLISLAIAWCGCGLGVWLVCIWRTGFWGRLSLLPQAAALATVAVGLCFASMEDQPLALDSPQMNSAEKRRLVELLKNNKVQDEAGKHVRALSLSQRDVNLLLTWAFQVVGGESTTSQANVRFGQDTFNGSATFALPGMQSRFLNIQAAGFVSARDQSVDLRLQRFKVGRLSVPSFMLPICNELILGMLNSDAKLHSIVSRTELLRIRPDAMTIVVRQGVLVDGLLPAAGFGGPQVAESTLAQFDYLAPRLARLNAETDSFEGFVRASFSYAQSRSAEGSAANENRAAINALGILLGHREIGRLILGSKMNDQMHALAKQQNGRVALRGRHDWTQHFFVSAALAVHSNEMISDAAGLLKEELDAGEGGSGFSFCDLLADRAGTRFALAATSDDASARAMQLRLTRGWKLDEIFPQASDLPEGLTEDQLQEEFGGIGGEAYRQMLAEMERRLDQCPLLR